MTGVTGPNVVWVTIDSIRADRTTMGGHARDTTPNVQRIADRPAGESFDSCIAQTRWTPASTASILTGTYLSTHQVGIQSPDVRRLPESLKTMPQLLSEVGYESLGIGTNQYVCSATGMDRGFDRFMFPTLRNIHRTVGVRAVGDYLRNIRRYGPGLSTDVSLHNGSSMVTHAAERWLRSTARDGTPCFLYLHYNATHYPYTPPKHFLRPYAEETGQSVDEVIDTSQRVFKDVFGRVADGLDLSSAEMDAIKAASDAELAYIDDLVGRLFDYVQDTVPGETVFVVTSDHGETFGEYGWLGHHVLLTDELLHVPMVTHGLSGVSHASDGPVQHVDFTRTILEQFGAGSPQLEGVNLTDQRREYAFAQRGSRASDREKLLDRNGSFDVSQYRWDALNSVHDGRFKLLTGEEGEELFVLPGEEEDVAGCYPRVARQLSEQLAASGLILPTDTGGDGDRMEVTREMRDRLEHMGYL